jgi:hypothetical protein
MSGLERLGKLLELKYGLVANAASNAQILSQVKKDLLLTYKLYVNPETAKEPVLQMLANAGEPFSKRLIIIFSDIVTNIDDHSNTQLYTRVNNLLGMVHDAKLVEDVRKFIHNSVRATKESERNYREHLKSKFEMILHRITSLLDKQLKLLQQVLPRGIETRQEGGPLEPQRKELSKEQLLMFMRTPAAQQYRLDDMDVMYQLLSDPVMKSKITTLVNAISRGHVPVDGPAVTVEAKAMRDWIDQREKTNLPALENSPEKQPANPNLFEEEGEAWDHKMAHKYNDLTLERYHK